MTVTLSMVIRRVESSDGQNTIRFEHTCYTALVLGQGTLYTLNPNEVVIAIAKVNGCTIPTAQMIFATSYGDYQDMGFEIYGELFPDTATAPKLRDFWASIEMQDKAFGHWCGLHGFNPMATDFLGPWVENFARAYNGPDFVAPYAAKIRQTAAEWSPPLTPPAAPPSAATPPAESPQADPPAGSGK